ncbi:C2H2 zinc finger [Fusarium subglutinans]|uniref:C2H2 zinc finger n=1 Tax=Gibberella subglutinans TaxID=42677 RepID=A0A8H5PE21_GIBSU|nr:C2H2 zinc finger [Fusarium subglutinans]KAF5594884.1 C2H2 zinc finger [Fusarium subglutinans]
MSDYDPFDRNMRVCVQRNGEIDDANYCNLLLPRSGPESPGPHSDIKGLMSSPRICGVLTDKEIAHTMRTDSLWASKPRGCRLRITVTDEESDDDSDEPTNVEANKGSWESRNIPGKNRTRADLTSVDPCVCLDSNGVGTSFMLSLGLLIKTTPQGRVTQVVLEENTNRAPVQVPPAWNYDSFITLARVFSIIAIALERVEFLGVHSEMGEALGKSRSDIQDELLRSLEAEMSDTKKLQMAAPVLPFLPLDRLCDGSQFLTLNRLQGLVSRAVPYYAVAPRGKVHRGSCDCLLPGGLAEADKEAGISKVKITPRRFYDALLSNEVNLKDKIVTRSVDEPVESYIALSYPWKSYDSQDLEKVIAKTYGVLKHRYYWVDRWCIDQDSYEDKETEVPKMKDYYSNAEYTLILPGMAFPLELAQLKADGPKVRLYSPQLVQQVKQIWESCEWRKRCWTLQEAIMSKRCTFWTGQESAPLIDSSQLVGILCSSPFGNSYINVLPHLSMEVGNPDKRTLVAMSATIADPTEESIYQRAIVRCSSHGTILDANACKRPLAVLLDKIRGREATLELDEYYSLFSMASDKPPAVDYKIDPVQLMEKMVGTGALGANILLTSTGRDNGTNASWVPRMCAQRQYSMMGAGTNAAHPQISDGAMVVAGYLLRMKTVGDDNNDSFAVGAKLSMMHTFPSVPDFEVQVDCVIHGAANIAGIFKPKPIFDSTIQDWDLMMNVTVASAAGIRALPSAPVYAASKHAVVGLCASVAAEVGSKNIRVNTVAPGFIDTPMTQSTLPRGANGKALTAKQNPIARAAHPDEVAGVIVFLLSDQASFLSSSNVRDALHPSSDAISSLTECPATGIIKGSVENGGRSYESTIGNPQQTTERSPSFGKGTSTEPHEDILNTDGFDFLELGDMYHDSTFDFMHFNVTGDPHSPETLGYLSLVPGQADLPVLPPKSRDFDQEGLPIQDALALHSPTIRTTTAGQSPDPDEEITSLQSTGACSGEVIDTSSNSAEVDSLCSLGRLGLNNLHLTETKRGEILGLINDMRPVYPDGTSIDETTADLSLTRMQEYVDLFFANFNSCYPMIHTPTLEVPDAEPLFLLSMIVLGATYKEKEDHQLSVCLYDAMTPYIMSGLSGIKVPDLSILQAFMVLECYGMYRAGAYQRENAIIIHTFLFNAIRRLSRYHVRARIMVPDLSIDHEKDWKAFAYHEQYKRLILFIFMWDTQNVSYYSFMPSMSTQSIQVNLPCSKQLWEAKGEDAWKANISSEGYPPMINSIVKDFIEDGGNIWCETLDSLSLSFILHGLMSMCNDMVHFHNQSIYLGNAAQGDNDSRRRMTAALELWKTKYDACAMGTRQTIDQDSSLHEFRQENVAFLALYHTAHIVVDADIRHLQIAAGAEAIFGHVVTSAEREESTKAVMEWVRLSPDSAGHAAWHAAQMIREGLLNLRNWKANGMFHYPWCLYIGVLTTWAFVHFSQGQKDNRRACHHSVGGEDILQTQSKALMHQTISNMASCTPTTIGRDLHRCCPHGLAIEVAKYLKTVRWTAAFEAMKVLEGIVDMESL